MSGAYAAAVFVIVPVEYVVATVFDAPVTSVYGKHTLRVCLLRRSAGDAICNFTGVFAGFFIRGLPLDEKSLSDVRKAQIAVELGCGPDFADFYPTVIRRVALEEIGVLPVGKEQCDVFKKPGLIVFHRKVVMSFPVPDHILGDLTLGQQGVGGNIFALYIDGVKERAGGLDFVGALELVILSGQVAYFFWV